MLELESETQVTRLALVQSHNLLQVFIAKQADQARQSEIVITVVAANTSLEV